MVLGAAGLRLDLWVEVTQALSYPQSMRWHTSYALSEDLRLFLVDQIEAGDLHLRLYQFAYDPAAQAMRWRHQVKLLVDTDGGGREVVRDDLPMGSVPIPEKFRAECAKLA